MTEIITLPTLPKRAADSHKGTYGRVRVVAGSVGMSGAAILTGTAVLKSGAGLCTVACPHAIQPLVAAGYPCYTTRGFDTLLEALSDDAFDVLAAGPGLGVTHDISTLLSCDKPKVLDADALNVLATLPPQTFATPTVLTPHPGEFMRLCRTENVVSVASRLQAVLQYSVAHGVVLLLKGAKTIVSDGSRYYINTTGNPGMATGGSGDVLTGVIAALMAQGLDAFDAAVLGAYVHGRAGDLAAEHVGQVGMTALDILHYLPAAFK